MTKHTPGPWTAEPDPEQPEWYQIWHDEGGTRCTLAENIGSEANALLFAAAPDMLRVLEKVALFGENPDALSIGHTAALQELGRNARATIAKATSLD